MSELLTAEEMRNAERAAIEAGTVSGLELMERAGKGVVAAMGEEWPRLAARSHRAAILCGPGNNGGDGFVVARLLRQAGWAVETFLFGDPMRLPPDARANHDAWHALGPVRLACAGEAAAAMTDCDLLVDALFGTGLARPIESPCLHEWFARFVAASETISEQARPATLAIDLPSGLHSDSGEILGAAPIVALTVTFHRMKRGHRVGAGPEYCGRVVVKDIGL